MKDSHIRVFPVLQPLAFLFGTGVKIRNWLFDDKVFPSEQYPMPVICVGNLAVGGTGKTPLVEYLIRMLNDKYRIAVLSRGYKRESSGYVLADEKSTVSDIGDEACQIKSNYPQVIVVVDGNRRRGMRNLLAMPKDVRPQVVLLDDGFQHRLIKPSFSIIVTDYNRLFYTDRLLPAGRLREPAKSAARADMVVVSKCPENVDPADCEGIIEKVKYWLPLQNIFFSANVYQPLKGVFPEKVRPCTLENISKDDTILLITGIANPTPLIKKIQRYSDKVNVLTFGDHHAFTKKDILRMQSELSTTTGEHPLIICTEKDAARIRHNPHFPNEWKSRMYYIPVMTHFLHDGHERFEKIILHHIALMIENHSVL